MLANKIKEDLKGKSKKKASKKARIQQVSASDKLR